MYKFVLMTVVLLLILSLITPGVTPVRSNEAPLADDIFSLYQSLNDTTLNAQAFSAALIGYKLLKTRGSIPKDDIITIIDYTKPSVEKRFFVIDLHSRSILYKTYVAHGKNSGDMYANRFSNKAQSHESALGFYITGNTYIGSQGYSLQMHGIDTGYNENAAKRAIVIHGARYATVQYIKLYGRLGRSFGCPALPPDITTPIIDLIKEGTLIFSYYPDRDYFSTSSILGFYQAINLHNALL
jgi:hypothetical protein